MTAAPHPILALTPKGERYILDHAEAVDLANRRTLNRVIDDLIRIREEAAAMVAHLIDLVDDADGDADLEPATDDEPAIGWTEQEARWSRYGAVRAGEDEDSLGWTSGLNQARLATRYGAPGDLEAEFDGREEDDPPEDADTGFGDLLGLIQQCGSKA